MGFRLYFEITTILFPGTRAKTFNGNNFLEYTFQDPEPTAEMILTVGFITAKAEVALAQLEGEDFRHITLALVDGYLTLYYSMKKKVEAAAGFSTDNEVKSMRITKRRLNDNEHNVARIHFSTDSIYMYVPNYDLSIQAEMTERIVIVNGGDVEELDKFGMPKKVFIGRARDIKAGLARSLPTSFEGCMSGAKIVVQPHATTTKPYRRSLELDLFKMLDEQNQRDNDNNNNQPRNPIGDLPIATECGKSLRIPGIVRIVTL